MFLKFIDLDKQMQEIFHTNFENLLDIFHNNVNIKTL